MNTPPQQAGLTTEEDIASYLISTPEFFERFAEVLGSVQLANPYGPKAVSLHERQIQILREKIKSLEASIVELMGYGSENASINQKNHRWVTALLQVRNPAELPEAITGNLQTIFGVPQVILHLWALDDAHASASFAQPVTEQTRQYAQSLQQPYCGPVGGVEGLAQIAGPGHDISHIQSLAVLPLRYGNMAQQESTFGYLLLTSPDAHRYTEDMGTELLARMAELASASLQRLLNPAWLGQAEQRLQASVQQQAAAAADPTASGEPSEG